MPSPTHPPTDTGAIGAERSVLEGLLARVEAASGPDRELDRAIVERLGFEHIGGRSPGWWDAPDLSKPFLGDWRSARLSASLDAVLTLKNRVLPGHAAAVGDMAFEGGARLPWGCIWNSGGSITGQAEAKTPALALIAAMLRALIAQAPSPATTPTGVLETSLIVEGDSSVARANVTPDGASAKTEGH